MAKVDSIREIKEYAIWWEQKLYWETHLDVFIQQYFNVVLKDVQAVIARAIGNSTNIKLVQSRGFGKTWQVAWCAIAICILHPNTKVAVVSATAEQATLVLKKIRDFVEVYPQLKLEIELVGRDWVPISNAKGRCVFKNGSSIESFSINTVVGERAKVLIIDEAPRADKATVDKNATPVLRTTRDVCIQNGYEDFDSKVVSITSACLKSNYFYVDFMKSQDEMSKGNERHFACALDYTSSVRVGLEKMAFYEEKKNELPESVFATEYGSMFLGEEANSVFRYELTDSIRTIKRIEYSMPKNSKYYYVMGVDLATSDAKNADNAVITVIKCIERDDGTIMKHVVYLRTYHGKKLDELADEVRRTYVRFPNTTKIIFDHGGLGDAFELFFKDPWTDPFTGKEYPPWVLDSEASFISGSEPMLYSFKANNALNNELGSKLRVAVEKKTIALPIWSHEAGALMSSEDIADEDMKGMTSEERAVYIEADALQFEMGNIVLKMTEAGNYTYNTAKSNQHKDRYSSLAMAVWYISKLEEELEIKLYNKGKTHCIGIVVNV